ncbi:MULTISPECIES: DUF3108 domain-containing protein [Gammaproteobacteria]|uniref:DUF3108 domain-containing protein n=1 Tax=Gammaproteobacteria TaxID=1236 RepID=UPI000F808FB6|nr:MULTISPECIES: DUF3108 domain-containing protein [Gammaproteobacteria]RTE87488.1 DUF3108 domain-containing protein [Aliidiomarina sp. B3213]TCZ92727.1 DUF3108 domain-containing protein [Lysobacter sp. N42]
MGTLILNSVRKIAARVMLLPAQAFALGLMMFALSPPLVADESVTAEVNQPYVAHYEVTRRGRSHGEAIRRLELLENSQYRYYTETEVSFLFLSDRRVQITEFEFVQGQIHPLVYEYERTGTGSDDQLTYDFAEHSNEQNILDANSVLHQLQLGLANGQSEFEFDVLNEHGERETYRFEVMGDETVSVPYGTLDTLKVARVRNSQRRETYFWFSPLLNYSLVQMQQIKEGKEQAKLSLKSIQLSALQES